MGLYCFYFPTEILVQKCTFKKVNSYFCISDPDSKLNASILLNIHYRFSMPCASIKLPFKSQCIVNIHIFSLQLLPYTFTPQKPELQITTHSGTFLALQASLGVQWTLCWAVPRQRDQAVCSSPVWSLFLCWCILWPMMAKKRKWSKDTKEQRPGLQVKHVSFTAA
jgi:hypothetical protein